MKLSTSIWILGLLLSVPAANAQKSTAPAKAPTSTNRTASWITFSDPLEQAFSLDVPAGWTVRGGLYRKGVLDPRIMVEATSPDGKIRYRVGDDGIPPYTIPSAMGMQLGFTEGAPYSPGGRVQGMIARYRTGTQFADLYAQAHFSKFCRNVEVKSIRRADPLLPVGLTNDNAGEVVFTCDSGGPMAGYVYAQSSLSGTTRDGLWGIPVIYSLLAPQSQAKPALQMLTHSLASFRYNPQWTQAQLGMIRRTNEEIQKEGQAAIELAHRRQQRADQQLKLAEDVDDLINGVTLTRDPTTGQTREIVSTPNQFHWVDPSGRTVTTQYDTAPGPTYRKQQTISRGQR